MGKRRRMLESSGSVDGEGDREQVKHQNLGSETLPVTDLKLSIKTFHADLLRETLMTLSVLAQRRETENIIKRRK